MAVAIYVALLCYLAIGVAVGCAFVLVGVMRLQAAPVSAGARILLLPGSIILWPLILSRWLKHGNAR
jgi:hypothetical protein